MSKYWQTKISPHLSNKMMSFLLSSILPPVPTVFSSQKIMTQLLKKYMLINPSDMKSLHLISRKINKLLLTSRSSVSHPLRSTFQASLLPMKAQEPNKPFLTSLKAQRTASLSQQAQSLKFLPHQLLSTIQHKSLHSSYCQLFSPDIQSIISKKAQL